ncbi:hypothetical protein [Haloarchaeobius sp. HRN-SO-5]|uniref:hypothetical protein n=1 Tax=Haloarchaeobius sp. HRN-SO-5 TaxID=3446118 RepID=UPI003EBE7C9C
MTDVSRRRLLATVGSVAIGSLAGCSALSSEGADAPAGSLKFVNEHTLPHSVGLRVTGVGPVDDGGDHPPVPPSQRSLSATAALDAGETRTYDEVFTEPVRYEVAFTLDGRRPESGSESTMRFTPFPSDSVEDRSLRLVVGESGQLLWFEAAADAL